MPNVTKGFSKCVTRLVNKAAESAAKEGKQPTFTEDDAKRYLDEIAGLITDPQTGAISLENALRLTEELRRLPEAGGRERIYLNTLRRKIIDQKKIQTKILPKLTGLLDLDIPKESTLVTWLSGRVTWKDGKGTFEGVQDSVIGRVEAHKTLQNARYSQVIEKHNLAALPSEEFDKFMGDLFTLSRDPKASPASQYGSAAKDLLTVMDTDRGLFNLNGSDLKNNHGLIFNSPVDSIRLLGDEGRTRFNELWNANTIVKEEIFALAASLENTPRFRELKAEALAARKPEIDALKAQLKRLLPSNEAKDNPALVEALRRRIAAKQKLTPEEEFRIVQETVYTKLSKSQSVLDQHPEGSAPLQGDAPMIGVKNIIRDVDARHLFPFKDYQVYKSFMAEFGSTPSLPQLRNHFQRNSRLAETVNQTTSSPLSLLQQLETFFVKSTNTGSEFLDGLSPADRVTLWQSMTGLKSLLELKEPKYTVIYKGQVLRDIRLDKNGNIDPESLPRRDPQAKPGTPGYERISVDEVSRPSLSWLEMKSGWDTFKAAVSPSVVEDPRFGTKPEFLLRELTGEAFYSNLPSDASRYARRANTFVNLALLISNALTQVSDSVVAAVKVSTLREGGLSGSGLDSSIRALGQMFTTGGDVLQFTMRDYLNVLQTSLKMGRRPTMEQLSKLDRIGFVMESFNDQYLYDMFDQNLSRLSKTEQMEWIDRNLQDSSVYMTEFGGVNSIMRAVRQTMNKEMGVHATLAKQGKLTEGQIERLKAYNLTSEELGQAASKDIDGSPVIDPNIVEDMDLRTRITNFALEEMKLASGALDDRTRGFRTLGHDPNSPAGAIFSLVTNLASFQMNFMNRVLPNIAAETGLPTAFLAIGAMSLVQLGVINIRRVLKGDTIPYDMDPSNPENLRRISIDLVRATPLSARIAMLPVKEFTTAAAAATFGGKSLDTAALEITAPVVESGEDLLSFSADSFSAVTMSSLGFLTQNEEQRTQGWESTQKVVSNINTAWLFPTAGALLGNTNFVRSMYWLFSQTLTHSIGFNATEAFKEALAPEVIAERQRRRYNRSGIRRIFDDNLGEPSLLSPAEL